MTPPKQDATHAIADSVPPDSAGAQEIGFAIPQQYNASRILFDNLVERPGGQSCADRPGRNAQLWRSFARKPRAGATACSRSD